MTQQELLKKIKQAEQEKWTKLELRDNQLTSLPPEIGNLANLTRLELSFNKLTALPPEIGNLANLTMLGLIGNQLTALLPEIANLTNLTWLNLSRNQLTILPPEIGNLANLTMLELSINQLTVLPPEIGNLTNLTRLNLGNNQLTVLPPEIGNLANLIGLGLGDNPLTALPPEIVNLANLTVLNLASNQLTVLPPEIGKLTNLTTLNLVSNQLTALPPEIGNLKNLKGLWLDGNPMTNPPPEIVDQGTGAVLAYLRAQLKDSRQQWTAKMLVVGEGGVGKTAMLCALRDEKFDPNSETTHGIEIKSLECEHPQERDVIMQLKAWDFGGQAIYHATHQFFLSNRSLFVVVWNARLGFEQGKLYYWLDTIHSLAPDSPILIVATHIDERDADIPLADLKLKYPQIVGQCEISNKKKKGIKELRTAIADVAAKLPLMGTIWPTNWLNAADAVRDMEGNFCSHKKLLKVMTPHKVKGKEAAVLTQWLHDLGDILYFPDDEELQDTVILKPQWVSKAVSNVLESEEVIKDIGLFTRKTMKKVWRDIGDSTVYTHLLDLMEKFDLSYRTLDNKDVSLVVERLSLSPVPYEEKWEAIKKLPNCREISMKFELDPKCIPAGVPTWFIARSHRFSMNIHWRHGALFTDRPAKKHLGLVRAFNEERYIELTVRGPVPHNFFALLCDGLELTLARFPGLKIKRTVPCPGHDGETCDFEFDYDLLLKGLEKNKASMECHQTLEDVSISQLLSGLHVSTQDELLKKIYKKTKSTEQNQRELRSYVHREFTKLFRLEQSKIESYCPNTFVLRPRKSTFWGKNLFADKTMQLQLYCQAPGQWHPTTDGGNYVIDKPAEWVKSVAPIVGKIVTALKYASPLVLPGLQTLLGDDVLGDMKNDIKLMTAIIKKLPEIEGNLNLARHELAKQLADLELVEGADLRALKAWLLEKDPEEIWGGLRKILTPEGHYLWLCDHHAKEYR